MNVVILTGASGKLLRLSPAAYGGHGFVGRLAFGFIGFEDGRSEVRGKLTGRR